MSENKEITIKNGPGISMGEVHNPQKKISAGVTAHLVVTDHHIVSKMFGVSSMDRESLNLSITGDNMVETLGQLSDHIDLFMGYPRRDHEVVLQDKYTMIGRSGLEDELNEFGVRLIRDEDGTLSDIVPITSEDQGTKYHQAYRTGYNHAVQTLRGLGLMVDMDNFGRIEGWSIPQNEMQSSKFERFMSNMIESMHELGFDFTVDKDGVVSSVDPHLYDDKNNHLRMLLMRRMGAVADPQTNEDEAQNDLAQERVDLIMKVLDYVDGEMAPADIHTIIVKNPEIGVFLESLPGRNPHEMGRQVGKQLASHGFNGNDTRAFRNGVKSGFDSYIKAPDDRDAEVNESGTE